MLQNTNAFNEVSDFIAASIIEIDGISSPVKKYFISLMETWLMMPFRYTMNNLSRYMHYCEKSIRLQMERKFPFMAWMERLLVSQRTKECILALDPSHLSKSGKKTYGLGKFWSGKDQRVKRGLEATCLALIDVKQETAYHLEAVQTPSQIQHTLIEHYRQIILDRIERLKEWSRYLVVDGYFMRKNFIVPISKRGMHVITKMRSDANLQYVYKGEQKGGRGRKRKVAGKIQMAKIDKRRWKKIQQDDIMTGYELVCWCVTLKQVVKVVYLESKRFQSYQVLLSTDTGQRGEEIIRYYRLRFQIEFLIRDAKQHTGLEQCQARSEEKLYNHFNMSLSAVTVAKKLFWEGANYRESVPFSMQGVKRYCFNVYMTKFIFSNLDLDLRCKKIKRLFVQCLDVGRTAA